MNPRRIVSAVSALLLLLIVVSFGPAFAENLLENADFTELDDDGECLHEGCALHAQQV